MNNFEEQKRYAQAERQVWAQANHDLETRTKQQGADAIPAGEHMKSRNRALLNTYQSALGSAIADIGDKQGVHTNWMQKGAS